MKPIDAASELCTLVFAGNLPLLKRYIAAGIEVDIEILNPSSHAAANNAAVVCRADKISQAMTSTRQPERSEICLPVMVQVDAGDYDQRAALHIAACEQNLSAVRLLHSASLLNPINTSLSTPLLFILASGADSFAYASLQHHASVLYFELSFAGR